MTDNTKPEAMDLADWLEAVGGGPSAKRCAALLREQYARIAELESELEAVGAGGVSGPLVARASLSANAGEPRNAIDRDALIDAIAQGLHGTWHCTRVWEAWHVGTMSQDDFEPVDESETPTEIADAVLALLAAPPTAQVGGWRPIETAPKDKSNIVLLRQPCGSIANGFWLAEAYAGNGAWVWPYVHKTPTHWMPLPPPPTSAEGVEHG